MNFLKWFIKPFYPLNQNPILYKGKKLNFVYFGIFAGLAAFIGLVIIGYYLHVKGIFIVENSFLAFPIYAIANWGGARVGHLLAFFRQAIRNPTKYLNQAGYYVQGAIISAILTMLFFSYLLHFSFLIVADAAVYGALAALVIGRQGCFNYGCCFGVATNSLCGVRYFHSESKILRLNPDLKGVSVHPTQLYQMYLNLGAFLGMTWLIHYGVPDGVIGSLFLVYHGGARLFINRFRDCLDNKFFAKKYLPSPALIICITGILLLLFGYLLPPRFMMAQPHPFIEAFSMRTFFDFIYRHPSVILQAFLTSLVLAFAYGLHGKKVGTFVNED